MIMEFRGHGERIGRLHPGRGPQPQDARGSDSPYQIVQACKRSAPKLEVLKSCMSAVSSCRWTAMHSRVSLLEFSEAQRCMHKTACNSVKVKIWRDASDALGFVRLQNTTGSKS
jgi:hypothetical protein